MSDRLFLFEKITLPGLSESIKRAIDFDVGVLVLTSNYLPESHRRQLVSACSKYSFVDILSIGEEKEAIKSEVSRYISDAVKHDEVYFTCRLDDDDTLSKDYFKNLSPYITKDLNGIVVTVPNGYTAIFSNKQKRIIRFGTTYSPYIGLGLGLISIKDDKRATKTILDLGNHARINENSSVLHLNNFYGYLRILHHYSDQAVSEGEIFIKRKFDKKTTKEVGYIEVFQHVFFDKLVAPLKELKIDCSVAYDSSSEDFYIFKVSSYQADLVYAEYAFYFIVDGVKLSTVWYSPHSEAVFELPKSRVYQKIDFHFFVRDAQKKNDIYRVVKKIKFDDLVS